MDVQRRAVALGTTSAAPKHFGDPLSSLIAASDGVARSGLLVTWLIAAGKVVRVPQSRAVALAQLPRPYSLALRLREQGVSRELIAECLDIEPEGLDPLLYLAEAKLAAVQQAGPADRPLADDMSA